MTSCVQLDLFSGPDGSVSTFYVYPEEAGKNGYLRDYIEASGGMLLDSDDEDDPCGITLVDVEWVKSTKHSVDLEIMKDRDCFYPKFIYDCYQEQAIQDLNKYIIGQSLFSDYDANDLLHRRKTWSEITKVALRQNGDLEKGALSRIRQNDKRPGSAVGEGEDKPRNMARRTGKSVVAVTNEATQGKIPRPLTEPPASCPNVLGANGKAQSSNSSNVEVDRENKESPPPSKIRKKRKPKPAEEMDLDVNEQEASDTPVREPKRRKKDTLDDQSEIPHPNQEVHIQETATKIKKKKRKHKSLQETEGGEGEGTASVGEIMGENEMEISTSTPVTDKKDKRKKKKKKHNKSSEIPQDNVNESLTNLQFNEQNGLENEDAMEDEEIEKALKKKRKSKKIAEEILDPKITKKPKKRSKKEASPELIILSDDERVQNGDETRTRSGGRRSVTSTQDSATNNRKSADSDSVKKLQENGTSRKRSRRPSSTSLGNADFTEGSELVIAPNSDIRNFDSDSEDIGNEPFLKGPEVLEAVNKYRKPQKTPVKKKSKSKPIKSDDSDSDSDTQITRAANTPAKKNFNSGKTKRSTTNAGLIESSTLREVEISPKRRSKTSSITKGKRFIFDDSSSSSSNNGDSDYFPL